MARGVIRFPGAEQVSGPASMRPSGSIAVADASGIGQGLDAIDRGLSRFAQGAAHAAAVDQKKRDTAQVAKAEAAWLRGSLELGNRFAADPDFATFNERAEADSLELRDEAAALIDDEELRQRWADETELRRITVVDGINDRGRSLEREANVVSVNDSLRTASEIVTDPMTPKDVRDRALRDIEATIEVSEASGLLDPAQADKARETYVRGSRNTLAARQIELDLRFRPEYVRGNTGISPGMTGGDLAGAVQKFTGGQPVVIDYNVAGEVGKLMGDNALPSDPKLRAAYLTDPDVNARYVEATFEYLDERYRGDTSAVIVASVPGGSLELADQWVKSKHDESKLPPAVRKAYREVVATMAPPAEIVPLPAIAADGVNLEALDTGVLTRWEATQSNFGQQLTIISGTRSAEHNAEVGGAKDSMHIRSQAIDIDVSGLSKDERIKLIQTASAQGFRGIGVYANSIHLDMGGVRVWGPSYHGDSVPAWAKAATDDHVAGKVTVQPGPTKGVAPEYADLTFDQRLAAYDKAKIAADANSMNLKSGIEIDVANAPAAIMQTGGYDRPIPSAADFVAAYGAADGIEKFKTFDASIQAAEKAYGMRTMSADDIAALVEASTPTNQGDMAQAEAQQFEVVSQAAKSVLDARDKDPASYTMQVFPAVADAWENAGDDPVAFQQAVARMALGQEQLGIADMRLLPTDIAKQGADTFNDATLTQAERIGAVTHLVMATPEGDQQEAIFAQLVDQGVPPMVQGAMAALSRGDVAAAEYLFKAATVDPAKLNVKLPDGTTDQRLQERVTEKLYDKGQIGDVIYGLTNGTADNLNRLGVDSALIERAVKLRLLDGSAANLDEAIDLTAKDMFGDVKVVTGPSFGGGAGVRIVLPKDQNEKPMLDGFNALLPVVGQAVAADMTPAMVQALTVVGGHGEAAVMSASRDMRVSDILETGYFASAGDAYVFIDATTGQAVPDPQGPGPLTFTREDILQASVAAEVARRERPAPGVWMLPGSRPY